MAFITAQNTRVLYGNVALSAYLQTVTPNVGIDMLDVSTLVDTSRQYFPSLRDFTLNLDGFFDDDGEAGSVFEALTTPISAGSTVPTSVAPNGFAAGNSVWLIPAKTVSYDVSSSVTDIVPFSMSIGSGRPSNVGISLADLAARTNTGNGTSVDNTDPTANGAVAHLHITAVSGTLPSLTVTVEHSANGSSWTTLGSFSAASTASSQLITVTGTVNRYVRAVFTISGTNPSFTCQASLARL